MKKNLPSLVSHIALALLAFGVLISLPTSFSGFGWLHPGQSMHIKNWNVRVKDTRRDFYASGQSKQWYTKIEIIGTDESKIQEGEISVNHPFSYNGVDIYQSGWLIDGVELTIDRKEFVLPVQREAAGGVAILPLDSKTKLVVALRDNEALARLFVTLGEAEPQLIAAVAEGQTVDIGKIAIGVKSVIGKTGLQYKSDPGLPIVFVALGLLTLGVVLGSVPEYKNWIKGAV